MTEKELIEKLDEVYNVGYETGRIKMKNTILKSLNRDWNLFHSKETLDLMIKVMKKIDKLK